MYPSFVAVDSYIGGGTGQGKIGPTGRKSTVNPICTIEVQFSHRSPDFCLGLIFARYKSFDVFSCFLSV